MRNSDGQEAVHAVILLRGVTHYPDNVTAMIHVGTKGIRLGIGFRVNVCLTLPLPVTSLG